jgi:ATP adenylyltransferase/5',5'''-P-1,P-4-tetraphosphate phosphorylase II
MPWTSYKEGLMFSLYSENVGKPAPNARFMAKVTTDLANLYDKYLKLLALAAKSMNLDIKDIVPHNIVMTLNWIVVVPRTSREEGGTSANACGMMGEAWIRTQTEFEAWKSHGPVNLLRKFGVPGEAVILE